MKYSYPVHPHIPAAQRLDRQLRIDGWNQRALEQAVVGVVGDEELTVSLFLLSAAALGLNRLKVLTPRVDATLVDIAGKLNPELRLTLLEGYYTHPVIGELFADCRVVVDFSAYALAAKLILQQAYQENRAVVRGSFLAENHFQGLQVFTYFRGREWQELEQMLPSANLPAPRTHDSVLSIILTGLALEEAKNLLMGRPVSPHIIAYRRKELPPARQDLAILVVGAGALGNFVGLGLAFSGFTRITFMDGDVVEPTNLNRQILFYDAVGQSKAETLAARLNHHWRTQARGVMGYFQEHTDVSPYDLIIDCVDNFESRIVLSHQAKKHSKMLVSGGAGVSAGQVVAYDPSQDGPTPAELLGLPDIVSRRTPGSYQRERAACVYQPDPAVIMTNQIVAGLMVDACRQLAAGISPPNLFYENPVIST